MHYKNTFVNNVKIRKLLQPKRVVIEHFKLISMSIGNFVKYVSFEI